MRRLYLDIDSLSVLRDDNDWMDADDYAALHILPDEKSDLWEAYQKAQAEYLRAFDAVYEALTHPRPLTDEEAAVRSSLDKKFNG